MELKDKKNGFTLIEILVVIGLLVLLFGLFLLSLKPFGSEKRLDATAQDIIQALRLAQNKTLASEGDSSFGVNFETDKFTFFKGTVYSAGAPDNEVHNLGNDLRISVISLGGATSVVFERLTGATQSAGSLKIEQVSDTSKNRTIFVDASGVISLSSNSPSDSARIKDSRHIHVLYSQNTKSAVTLSLVFPNDSVNYPVAYQDFLDPGKTVFDWNGTISVGGQMQVLRVHSHQLSDGATQFCFDRDRRYNSKALQISLDGQNLIIYDANGTTTQGTSLWAGAPENQ